MHITIAITIAIPQPYLATEGSRLMISQTTFESDWHANCNGTNHAKRHAVQPKIFSQKALQFNAAGPISIERTCSVRNAIGVRAWLFHIVNRVSFHQGANHA
jgi:hypothetical protein